MIDQMSFDWIDDLPVREPITTSKTSVFFDTIQCALMHNITNTSDDLPHAHNSLIKILQELDAKHNKAQLLNQTVQLWESIHTIKQLAYHRLATTQSTYVKNTNKCIYNKCLDALHGLDALVKNHVSIPAGAIKQQSLF